MRFIFILFMALATLMATGCDSPRNHRVHADEDSTKGLSLKSETFNSIPLKISWQWLAGPFGNVEKPSSLMVFVYGADGQLQSLPAGREINFYATMPDMGHPLDQPGYFEEISTGIYLNKTIVLNMGGEWLMELWLQDENFEVKDKIQWSEFL